MDGFPRVDLFDPEGGFGAGRQAGEIMEGSFSAVSKLIFGLS